MWAQILDHYFLNFSIGVMYEIRISSFKKKQETHFSAISFTGVHVHLYKQKKRGKVNNNHKETTHVYAHACMLTWKK